MTKILLVSLQLSPVIKNGDITRVQTYDEGLEMLGNENFDIVLADAQVKNNWARKFLVAVRDEFDEKPLVVIRHHQPSDYICEDRKCHCWQIPISIQVHYAFATFFQGDIWTTEIIESLISQHHAMA